MGPPPREYTRVALVQLDYQPATLVGGRSPLEDPLFGVETRDGLLPRDGIVPRAYRAPLRALRKRLRRCYLDQLRLRLDAVISMCRSIGARVIVLPEYCVPWDLLEHVAASTSDLLLVAGSHVVEKASRLDRVHEALGAPSTPPLGEAVCPVMHDGRLVALQPKLRASAFEDQLRPGHRWAPVSLPHPLPGPMGVFCALDFLCRGSVPYGDVVDLGDVRYFAVPTLDPFYTLPGQQGQPMEEARRSRRPVLLAAGAAAGGTAVYVGGERPADLALFPEHPGWLGPGEEGVLVADVDLGYAESRGEPAGVTSPPILPVALASLVYPARVADAAYAGWLAETAPLLGAADAGLDEMLDAVSAAEEVLLDAGEPEGAGARRRRLWRLLTDIDRGGLVSAAPLGRFLAEVVLPEDALPMSAVRRSLAAAAADVVGEWTGAPGASCFRAVVARLRGAAGPATTPERGSWTASGVEAIAALLHPLQPRPSLVPEPPPASPQEDVREAMLAGIDVSALDELEVEGFHLEFAADSHDLASRPDRTAGAEGKIAPPGGEQRVTDELEQLRALALAEGAHSAGAVRVEDRRRHLQALLSLATWDGRRRLMGRFVAWDGNEQLMDLAAHLELYVLGGELTSALQDDCLPDLEEGIELLSDADMLSRVRELRPRFVEAQEAAKAALATRLRPLSGHMARVDLRGSDGERVPGVAALDGWCSGPRRHCLVEGGFGAGKSTLIAEWSRHRWSRGESPLPVLVDLASAPPTRSPSAMLLEAARLPDTPGNRAALRLLVAHGQLLPCFDGFDEMAARLEPYELPGRLAELLGVRGGAGRVLVASRSWAFSRQGPLPAGVVDELLQILGAPLRLERLTLLPLEEEQVREIVEALRPEDAQASLARIAGAHSLSELASRPLLLGMALRTLDDLDPDRRCGQVDLHEAYVRWWLEQTRAGDRELVDDTHKELLPEALAAELHHGARASCGAADLAARLRTLSDLPDEALERDALLAMDGGAFIVEEAGSLRFAHRAFFDFFLARYLARAVADDVEGALGGRPVSRDVAGTLAEILRRQGDATRSRPVVALQRWLASGRSTGGGSAGALAASAKTASAAVTLLVDLRRSLEHPRSLLPDEADLRMAHLGQCDLAGAVLRGARLRGADLSGANLRQADLTGADLGDSSLDGAELSGADLSRADLSGASMVQASGHGTLFTTTDLRGADLRQSTWTDCHWDRARLAGAVTTGWVHLGRRPGPAARSTPTGVAASPAGHAGRVSALSWSPDGRALATAGIDGTIRLWSARTGAEAACFGGHRAPVTSVAFSPLGGRVASASGYGAVRVWDVETGAERARLAGHRGFVLSVSWAPDARRLASAGGDGTIRIWDTSRQREAACLKGHKSWVLGVAFSPDGTHIASVGGDGTVRLWNPRDGRCIAVLEGHTAQVTAVAWAPDCRRLATASDDGTLRIWDRTGGAPPFAIGEGEERYAAVAWSPDGATVASASEGGGVWLWDPESGALEGRLRGTKSRANGVAFSPDGERLAAACDDGTARVWRTNTRREEVHLTGLRTQATAVAWSPAGSHLASASDDGTLRVWDALNGIESARLEGHGDFTSWISWSPDGSELAASADDGTIRLWAPGTGSESTRLAGRVGEVNTVAWTTSGLRFASTAEDDAVRLWDPTTGAEAATLLGHQGYVSCLSWTPDGGKLASASDDGTIRVWNTEEGLTRAKLEGHRGRINALAWAPGEGVLASASDDGTVRVWDVETGEERRCIDGHHGRVNAIAWSPDGKRLASASDDGTARLWDATTAEELDSLEGHVGRVDSVAWAPDGSRLATACDDGAVRLWWWPRPGQAESVLELTPGRTLARTPGGFCALAGSGPLALGLARPDNPGVLLYRPLAGLEEIVDRPDKIAAALSGNLSGDDLGAELLARGWAPTRSWDGSAQALPGDTPPVGSDTEPTEPASNERAHEPPRPALWNRLEAWLKAPTDGEEGGLESTSSASRDWPPSEPPALRRNPFRPFAAPATEGPLLGRGVPLGTLLDCLAGAGSAVIRGPRRAGKTATLAHLEHRLRRMGRSVRRVSLSAVASTAPDDLARALEPTMARESRPAEALFRRLEAEADKEPVLLLDDAGGLAAADLEVVPTVFGWLHGAGDPLASVVLACSDLDWHNVMRHAGRVQGSAFGHDMLQVPLGPLDDQHAIELLESTAPQDVPIRSKTTARWILDLCGPWPFYLQVMGHAVVSEVRLGRRGCLVRATAVEELYLDVLLRGHRELFAARWTEMPRLARAALLSGGAGRLPDVGRLARSERAALRDAYLHDARQGWLIASDRPWLDWIGRHHRELNEALWRDGR